MKALKLTLIVLATLMVFGWILKGLKLLMWIGLGLAAIYFIMRALEGKEEVKE